MSNYQLHTGSPISDSENEQETSENALESLSTSIITRHVSFSNASTNSNEIKGMKPVPTKPRRQRLRTISRSIDERVSFHGRNPIYIAGRPAWYDVQGTTNKAFVIGICGGSASGKTTVAQRIVEKLKVPWVTLLSMDSFYKVLDPDERKKAEENNFDFDHPNAFDLDLLLNTLEDLKMGKPVDVPSYNFTTHSREQFTKRLYGANVIIFEGILAFIREDIRDVLDMKVFVDTDADIRLARRLKRDASERGRDIDGIIKQYIRFVKPSYDHYIAPTMCHADLIVPRGGENQIAIDLIVRHVNRALQKVGVRVRDEIASRLDNRADLQMPNTFYLVDQTKQLKYLHTIIRNKETDRDEFIFYSKRLMRILIEYALSLLPFDDVDVETPQGGQYHGKKHKNTDICGVSIIRAGECLELALSEVCKDVKIGKILIQTNPKTNEPELHFQRLPRDIANAYVFLLDATIATGAAALMAIKVLLDYNVPEDRIALLSLLASKQGIQTVAYVFPKVKIVATAHDNELDPDTGFIQPGLGNFGDRYFGTDFIHDLSDNDDSTTSINSNNTFFPCSPSSPFSPSNNNPLFNQDSIKQA